VKGEAIAGTIDDTSANTTDASIPPSGASTPPTSASESEAPAKATKISDKKNKRKREADDAPQEVKKAKKANMKREKTAQKASATTTNSAQGQSATARKIAKLSPKKKAWYEQRAAVKNQTIEEYISRRVEKKSAKKSAKRATTRLDDSAAAPAPFFTDLEGDVTLLQPATPALPAQPILGVVKNAPADEATVPPVADAASPVPDTAAPKKAKKVRKAHLPSDKPSGKKAYLNMTREKRKVKKDEKKAFKAEKAATKSNSKWGNNKADSRWGKIKAAKQAEKGE
jgi:nucleolar protein TMA23